MEDEERLLRLQALSLDVMRLTRNTLLMNLRFLDAALSRLDYSPDFMVPSLATDGEALIFNPQVVLQRYVKDKNAVTRDYLHAVFHCIFRHMFVHTLVDHESWNLACDIAVEYSISQLNLPPVQVEREAEQRQALKDLLDEGITMTAEKLYRFILDQEYTEEELRYFRALFAADDHTFWYVAHDNGQDGSDSGETQQGSEEQQANNGNGQGEGENGDEGQTAQQAEAGDGGNEAGQDDEDNECISCELDWKNVSQRMQMELETFAKEQGEKALGLVSNLQEVNREKYDYAAFLRKFAVMTEALKVNDDEFDYIYYTYGLNLYGDMPLVEPLEYKEVKLIREFVIAIDTSGSTAGDLVQKFLTKTYNILMTGESFHSRINIHLIQCDAEVQQDIKIGSKEEFDTCLNNLELRGMGGTDFRPVFEYVEALRKQGEFSNLKGLIYFTDGYGTFPERKPDYETAFVFLEDGYNNPEIPPWAIKLILRSDEI